MQTKSASDISLPAAYHDVSATAAVLGTHAHRLVEAVSKMQRPARKLPKEIQVAPHAALSTARASVQEEPHLFTRRSPASTREVQAPLVQKKMVG